MSEPALKIERERTYTRDEVLTALNDACSEIVDRAGPRGGTVDALNLLVNAAMCYLEGEQSDLEGVIEANYDVDPEEIQEDRPTAFAVVMSWIEWA